LDDSIVLDDKNVIVKAGKVEFVQKLLEDHASAQVFMGDELEAEELAAAGGESLDVGSSASGGGGKTSRASRRGNTKGS